MPKQPAMHHYIDSGTQALVCTHCQSVHPIPLGSLEFVCGVMKLFDKAHRGCKPGNQPKTWNSTPTLPLTTDENREVWRADIPAPPDQRGEQ